MKLEEALDILEHNWTRLVNADYSDKELDEALNATICIVYAIDKIKNDIENYPNFILCADGQKGIHIDEALKIIDKYTGGDKNIE